METQNEIPEIENEKNASLLELLNHPLELLRNGSKFGITGFKRLLTNGFLFGASNLVLFLYAIYRTFATELAGSHFGYVILVLLIGIGFTAYAISLTYKYIVINVLSAVYENSTSLLQRATTGIIDRVDGMLDGTKEMTDAQVQKAVNVGSIVNDKYAKAPRILKKGITMVLNRIPLVGMLMDVKEDLVAGNKTTANDKLYNNIDGFLTNSVFGTNNTKWVWWLLPLNIIISLVIIFWEIG